MVITTVFAHSQSKSKCDEYIGYNDQGNLASANHLWFSYSIKDTTRKGFFTAYLAKTDLTNGIAFYGWILGIGTIDKTTKIKIIFQDNSFIVLNKYMDSSNTVGMFDAVITDKYKLLLLKTKPIIKIQITGDSLDPMTYPTNQSMIDFMLSMDCLESYL